MKTKFCPNCGKELNYLKGNFYNCPNCVLIYTLDDNDRLIRFDIEEDDDEEETETSSPLSQPQVTVPQTPIDNVQNKPQLKKDNNFSNKSNALVKKTLVCACLCAVIATALLVITYAFKIEYLAFISVFFGIAMTILGVVLWAILPKKARKICPCCGKIREHHRRWVNTTSKTVNFNQGQRYTTKYTHHYIDTYTCPHCGETAEYKVTDSGGEIRVSGQYGYEDKRKQPIEF